VAINETLDSLDVVRPKITSPEHDPFAQATAPPLYRHTISLPNFAPRSH
jgi:hypothetical protein